MVTNYLIPSTMSQIWGACDPASLCDRNFDLCNTRFGLGLPTLNIPAIDEDSAPLALQGNFAAVAAAAGIVLFDVTVAADPEAAAQTNFERINAVW